MNSIIKNALKIRATTYSVRILSNRQIQKFYSTSKEVDQDPNEPLKFLGSEAQKWKAKTGRVGTIDPDEIPWYQTYSVVGSIAIFMIYFCILREENDIDEHLSKSIFESVPQLEVSTLISLYKNNLETNKDNTEVIKRLLELGIDPLQIK